jgi:nucleoside diphosphate kinase
MTLDFRNILINVFNENYLKEGQGLNPRRPPGDVYKNSEGHEITFQKFISIPSSELNDKELKKITKCKNISYVGENIPKNKIANIIMFKDTEGVEFCFVVFKPSSNKISHQEFKHLTGYSRQGSSSSKETIKLKPSDIIETDILMTPDELIKSLKKGLNNSKYLESSIKDDINNLVDTYISGKSIPVVLKNPKLANAYRDYIGEILAPWSCVKGYNVSGDYESSENALLGRRKYSDLKIYFSSSKNEGLRDSTLVLVGENKKYDSENSDVLNIGLSSKSKAGGGFAASMKNLEVALDKQPDEWIKDNLLISKIIKRISTERQENGPVIMAEEFGIISRKEAQSFYNYIDGVKSKRIDPSDYSKLPDKSNFFLSKIEPSDPSKTQAYYHVLAGMAKFSAEKINSDTSISNGLLQLLNNSNMIQVYTDVFIKDSKMMFKGFLIKFPPTFKGKVVLFPGTRFKTTSIQGKVGYKLL